MAEYAAHWPFLCAFCLPPVLLGALKRYTAAFSACIPHCTFCTWKDIFRHSISIPEDSVGETRQQGSMAGCFCLTSILQHVTPSHALHKPSVFASPLFCKTLPPPAHFLLLCLPFTSSGCSHFSACCRLFLPQDNPTAIDLLQLARLSYRLSLCQHIIISVDSLAASPQNSRHASAAARNYGHLLKPLGGGTSIQHAAAAACL